jgi:N-acetylglucosaminyldiphosphoundecaprenol N-acetyl-beta-D-mannosaminyltransferase
VARAALRDALGGGDGRCCHLVTLNPEYVMEARRAPAFAVALRAADLVTADGIGVVVAARLLAGASATGLGRVTGVEIVDWLAAESGPRDAPLFLLGAGPGVAAEAADALRRRHPGARIAGWWAEGSALPKDDTETLVRVAESGARAVAVAYGAPGQVLWIARNQAALAEIGVTVAAGVGGAFDFIAGRVPRAPAIMRRFGLEWLYRLMREPWRWRRQAVLPVFSVLVLREWLVRRIRRFTPW